MLRDELGIEPSPALARLERGSVIALPVVVDPVEVTSTELVQLPDLSAYGDLEVTEAPGPETVPVPNRSPGCRLQPLTVWWATICDTLQ